MGLQVDVVIPGGVTVADAYVRVSDVSYASKEADGKFYVAYNVEAYKDKATYAGGGIKVPVATNYRCEYDLVSADNAVTQIYNDLKTRSDAMADFTTATDVIE